MNQVRSLCSWDTVCTQRARLYNLKKKKIVICKDVLFSENSSWDWNQGSVQQHYVPDNVVQDEDIPKKLELNPPQQTSSHSPEQPSPRHSNVQSTPSSTPIRMRSLNEVYESYNYAYLSLKDLKKL